MLLRPWLLMPLIAAAPTSPVLAGHNLIVNGSFETGDFSGFRHVNTAGLATPAIVIDYDSTADYTGGGAFGEAVRPDDAISTSTDASGVHGAYFVDDFAANEALTQLTALHPGRYEIGFDIYLPQNGFDNVVDATLDGEIIGVKVATLVAARMNATHWYTVSGVAEITAAGRYLTSFTYNSNGQPAKDFVIDKVYVVASARAATAAIPPTPTAALPEPAGWMLMIAGFGLVGVAKRRRTADHAQVETLPTE